MKKAIESQHDRVQKLISWIYEAQLGHQVWRSESWEDYAFKDGLQWSTLDKQALAAKNINPLTANRIFPIINLILGNYILNQKDIVAKGRTRKDGEISQVMSESIAFVNDQNKGSLLQRMAFEDQITAGFGCIEVGYHHDPRAEKVRLMYHNWYNVWWDPYSGPWFDKEFCRYAFTASWKDIEDLKMLFPEKSKEIDNQADTLMSQTTDLNPAIFDEAWEIESFKSMLANSFWIRGSRTRIRPVEIWYPQVEICTFAIMPDGTVFCLDDLEDPTRMLEIITYADEIKKAAVKRMWVSTLLGTLELQHERSPYPHDEFPFVPYVGYVDRWKQPYGVPRQIKEQNMEVNKRRSMGLALLNSRRVIAEDGSMRNEQEAYKEANRTDGFIILKKDKFKRFKIEDMSNLAAPQIEMMNVAEREINEIAGPNWELQRNIPQQSGVALEQRKQNTSTVTASLIDNANISQCMLGERIMALIQESWRNEKVLRVVDRLTGVEKFTIINQRVLNENTGAIEIRNDITQGRFDIKIASRPMTDTMREKNIELLFAAINKASADAMPILLNLAFELSDLPDKEALLEQLRAATGTMPIDTDLTKAEREEQQRRKMAMEQAIQEQQRKLNDAERHATIREKEAKAENLLAEARTKLLEAENKKQANDNDAYIKGQELALKMLEEKNDTTTGSRSRTAV